MHDPIPTAQRVARAGHWQGGACDTVMLGYEQRFLRRKRLAGEGGVAFLADLAETVSLNDGDAFVLDDGRHVAVAAAAEPLLAVSGPDLVRLAWHIGNRHTPCEIGAGRLLIARDHVLEAMLRQLGASVEPVEAPFRPEGGAYGHGRTMGHDHGGGEPLDHGGKRHVHHHGSHQHGHDEDAAEDDPDL